MKSHPNNRPGECAPCPKGDGIGEIVFKITMRGGEVREVAEKKLQELAKANDIKGLSIVAYASTTDMLRSDCYSASFAVVTSKYYESL